MAENPYEQYRNMLPSGVKVGEAPSEPKKEDTSAADYADVPGGGALPQVQPAPGSVAASGPAWRAAAPTVVSGNAPGYRQSETLPIARREDVINDPNSRWYQGWAFAPGPLRALGQTAAENTVIDPATGNLSLAPEATTTASILAGRPDLRFSGATPLAAVPPGTLDRSAPLSPEFLRNPLAPSLTEQMPSPGGPTSSTGVPPRAPMPEIHAVPRPGEQGTQPSANGLAPGEPGNPPKPEAPARPEAVGAQITPASELGMSPKEEAAYRSTAEGQKLLEPQEPGIRDDKQYLAGERINEAEASQDVEVARRLKSLREQTPALDKEMTADEVHNNNIRTNAIQDALPGQVQITAAKLAREKAMADAEPSVFANAKDADVQPIVQTIREILNDPKNRQNTQLGQHVRPLIDRLINEDGTAKIIDPKELWGWRQDIQHLTSKDAISTDRNLNRISGLLGKVIEKTDDQLEASASGYKARLRDDYRTRSREIDAMEALNAERNGLFDNQSKPNYNAMQRLMRRITDARQENDPYNPFTHVTQETLDKLWAIRDSMRRSAAVDRLGAPRGSATSQNVGDALRMGAKAAATAAAPAVGAVIGNWVLPGVGGTVGGITAGSALNYLISQRGLAQRLQEGRGMLNRLAPQPPP